MGCWDIVCFLCGNPSHSSYHDSAELKSNIELYESKGKKSKSFVKYMKPIYNAYLSNPTFMEKIKIDCNTQPLHIGKLTNWMDSCTFLTIDNRVIHKCSEVECNVIFVDSERNTYTHDPEKVFRDYLSFGLNHGVFVHTDCYKWIKKTYKIDLKFSHLPIVYPKKPTFSYKVFNQIKYGSIEKYWEQDFHFMSAVINSDADLLVSPLASNSSTGKRIGKIFSQLKIRLDSKRVGPVVSASFYPSGTYRIGSNKKIWVISGGKWKELNEPVIKSSYEIPTKQINKVTKTFVAIGESGSVPVFIIEIKIKKANMIELILLTTQSQIEILNKKNNSL